jgi:predicted Zn-dependent peptidase
VNALRSELARTGTVIASSDNYDYSVLSFTATRTNFDNMWNLFTDVALHPAFTKDDSIWPGRARFRPGR